jgi:DNA-directed RNA polymerase subunit RPC12/RpoP
MNWKSQGVVQDHGEEQTDSDDDEDIYCRECGSDNLKYLETYANGSEYKCADCGTVQMW